MAHNVITKETGATVKPGPMIVAEAPRVKTDEQLASVAADSGLNGPFIADLLSSAVTHERMGVNLFRFLKAQTNNPVLGAKYGQLREESERCVDAYEELITALGGDVVYASPPARMTEGMDQHLISSFLASGSADALVQELKGVEAVLLGATLCVANTELVARLAQEAKDGPSKQAMLRAVTLLLPAQQEHVRWARETQQTMVVTQAKHPLAQKVGQVAEAVVGKIKDVLR